MKRIITSVSLFILTILLALPVGAVSLTSGVENQLNIMKATLLIISILLCVLLLCCIVFSILYFRSAKKKFSKIKLFLLIGLYITTAIVLACIIWSGARLYDFQDYLQQTENTTENHSSSSETTEESSDSIADSTDESTEETTTDDIIPDPSINPNYVDASNPSNWGIKWNVIVNGSIVQDYQRPETIEFGMADKYTELAGITTFRGDNYRTGATFGTATVKDETLTKKWDSSIGSFNTWTGCGWTGQPLVVRWDAETKDIMNLYPAKKEKENLVEIIYATMDGNIYFYDMDDGSYTRDPIKMGMNFKGAGTLDPRGYPLLYVGSGDLVPSLNYSGKAPRMYIVSLIDGKIIYERSGADSFAYRGWYAFDGAPLVDAETDTLIWPGESGIIYTMKLNTAFDKEAKTISVEPDTVRARYSTNHDRKKGFESSVIAVGEYLYTGDNGGMFFCMNANTMELVWAQDIHDDLNATPIFEWGEDGQGYLYLATSTEYSKGKSYVYKLNASTGEIVWEKIYDNVVYNADVSGGALSSPLLGKVGTDLEGMLIVHIARTPTSNEGTLAALNTQTGAVIWERRMNAYAWSTPTAVYTDEGKAYIILCDSAGNMHLINSEDGKTINHINLGSNIEASPVVFENTVVVGTRGQKVYAITVN